MSKQFTITISKDQTLLGVYDKFVKVRYKQKGIKPPTLSQDSITISINH